MFRYRLAKMTAAAATGLLFAFGGALTAAAPAAAAPAPVRAEDGVEPTTASLVADIRIPEGAQRATRAEDLAKFQEALQTLARTNNGKVTRSEVLVWHGAGGKSAAAKVTAALKQSGYTVLDVGTFDSEIGRVTPLAAMRGGKQDGLIGLWIVSNDGVALLAWGQFVPDTATAAANAKPAAKQAAASPANKDTRETDEQKRNKALKAYQDSQYVKMMGPITGPMYRPNKW